MARIRSIKPEFPQSESMGRISREARLTFILLWTLVDDSGRTRDSSRFLASMLYPYDDDAPALISGWLDELEGEGCITRYAIAHGSAKNNPHADPTDHYLQINKWLLHQKIDRPSPSKIPFDEGSSSPREGSSSPREPSRSPSGDPRSGRKSGSRHSIGDGDPPECQKVNEEMNGISQADDSKGFVESSRAFDEPSSTDLDMDMDLDLERKGKDLEGMQGEGSAAKKPKPHSRRTLPAAPPKGTPGLKKNKLEIEGLNQAAFAEWDCERRRRGGKSKASWTPAAQAKAAKLLAQHTPADQQAMVDVSIAAGWQGLFPPNKGNGRAKTFKQIDADAEEARMKPIREAFIKRHAPKPIIEGEVKRDE